MIDHTPDINALEIPEFLQRKSQEQKMIHDPLPKEISEITQEPPPEVTINMIMEQIKKTIGKAR